MDEKTIVKTMSLPFGRDWQWYGDLNVVVLAPHLCQEGRDRALDEVSVHWRRSCLRVVGDEPNRAMERQPLATLTQRSV